MPASSVNPITDTRRPPILPALRLVQSSRIANAIAFWLLVFLLLSMVAMAVVPWQQSARGSGKVVAFVPQERQQTVTAPTKGVVAEVASGLIEGARVERGDFILEIQPTAANLVEQLELQMGDLRRKMETAQTQADVYQKNVDAYKDAREAAIAAAKAMVESAQSKLTAKQKLIPGFEAEELQARLDLQRQEGLFDKGIKAERDIEKFRRDWEVKESKVQSAHDEVTAAEKEVEAKLEELSQKTREWDAKVESAVATREDAVGKAATIQKDMRALEVKLAELDRLVIKAPRDGRIYRLPVYERGQAVKEGDPLFTIVPEAGEQAVELWVSGNDLPLIQEGDHVRLQFEGWPAVQFAGWPSVAVGTFGGRVVAIDPADDGMGRFRVQVKEEQGPDDTGWPSSEYLRQGARVNGWVMLRRVPLGYEVWRHLNGFPLSRSKDPPSDDKEKTKKAAKIVK